MHRNMSAATRRLTCLSPTLILTLLVLAFPVFSAGKRLREIDINAYREKVRHMFYHAYEGYLTHAYPYDELQPLTCAGHDTWGSYSLTLIDAMDTLAVMGNYSEFRRIAHILIDKADGFFDIDINVSVFETNIRIVGGLLSAHLMMKRAGMEVEPGWPCNGPLLRMADNIARKILPAFDTATGMPYGTVNLRHGVPKGETTVTCTAGIGTFIVEFGTLSRLTGDPIYEKTAIRAIRALWKYRSALGLLGNHIDVSNGKWTAQDSGIGGGIDSYFEYLVKGAIMFNIPELLHMFKDYEISVKKYLKRDDWYMWAQMSKGTITLPLFTSLDGYWPSVKGMLGDIDEAMKTMHNFHQVWRQFGFTPEYYNIPKADVHSGREGYPLRPEIIESAMYLYRATKDPYLLEIGVDIVEAIEHSARTSCGYATVKDVRDHMLEDRMESFFLAETTKYLYLLFDPDNFIHNNGSHGDVVTTPGGPCVTEAGGYIFNTEAHPIDLAAVHCCSKAKKEEDKLLQEFHDDLDLLSLLNIADENDRDWIEAEKQKKSERNVVEDVRSSEEAKTLDSQREHEDDPAVCHNKEAAGEVKYTERSEDVSETTTKAQTSGRTSEAGDHEQTKKKHHLHVVDIASFTEAERNLTRIFMEELKMDSIMKNVSAVIAEKLKQQYKETEYERLAIDAARKILEAGSDRPEEKMKGALGVNASDTAMENTTSGGNGSNTSGENTTSVSNALSTPGENTTSGEQVLDTGIASNTPEENTTVSSRDKTVDTSRENIYTDSNTQQVEAQGTGESIEAESGMNGHERVKAALESEYLDVENKKTRSSETRLNSVTNTDGNQGKETLASTSHEVESNEENTDTLKVSGNMKNEESSFQPSVKITIKKSDGTQEVVSELHQAKIDQNDQNMIILHVDSNKEENEVASSDKSPTSQLETDAKVDFNAEVVNPTAERFKSHMQSHIQHQDDQKKQQLQELSSTLSPLKASESSLENKRNNLLSITTKILKLFSSGVTGIGQESEEAESHVPSLTGLYSSLANYPLSYFHDPSAMHCPARPFHSRISVNGEMFPDE